MTSRKQGVTRKNNGSNLNIELLESTFAALADHGEPLVKRFYEELFARHPEVKPLFKGVKPADQQKKLLSALKLVVNNLRNPEVLNKALVELGARHQDYGAKEQHYPVVAEVLLDVMKEFAGELWTEEVQSAWSDALTTIASTMLTAYKPSEIETMSQDSNEIAVLQEELAQLKSALKSAQTAVMMVDRNFVVNYVNDATLALLKKHETALATVYPGFRAEEIVGECIDRFHKNPAHQRNLLADPKNLPYQTDISIGDLKFALVVSAQIDLAGNYIGNVLEWKDVTDQRAKEVEVARLQSAVDGAQTQLMLCDADFNITYVNPAVIGMLSKRQSELRKFWPQFDAHKLVGQSIHQFHKNPAHQEALLSDLNKLPAKAEIKVGDLEFEVNATGITDAEGRYMGNMVEWRDITEQKDAERQIQRLIEAASVGQLDQRLDVNEFEGFFARLAKGVNEMLDAVVLPLQEGTKVMESLAKGDLTQVLDGEFHGQFGFMRDALNTSVTNLQDIVSEIRNSSQSIATSAGEIAQGNSDLSSRTEEQASSLEETASSMEEFTATVKQNADNAKQANQLAAGCREQAEKGGSVVGKAIGAMAEINSSSKKISDIIGVIDDIAFQTNLLALNAAVEAARAGDQGRGFAVVASEVRNLAQRSAAAAKEIKTLINDSVEKVEEGSNLVDESGSMLTEIVNSVKKVSDIIAEIAAASEEQSSGIEQVNKAISQMDQVTQQNAALVEEAAAASESMDDQAKNLERQMEYFNTGDESERDVPQRPERRTANRPWANRDQNTKDSNRAGLTKKPMKKAVGGDDDEWAEF